MGRGGAWGRQLGQPMGPLAQEPDRMGDGWLTNLFIWHISYPKATPGASQITRATAARDRTRLQTEARKCKRSSDINYEIQQQRATSNKNEHKHTEGKVARRSQRCLPECCTWWMHYRSRACVSACTRSCVYTAHLCKGTFIPDEQICTVSAHRGAFASPRLIINY